MVEWILANKCPHCGGRMILCDHFALTHDYSIRKDGKLSKRYKTSDGGSIDCITAFCSTCKTSWDGDNTVIDEDRVYIRGKGENSYL